MTAKCHHDHSTLPETCPFSEFLFLHNKVVRRVESELQTATQE